MEFASETARIEQQLADKIEFIRASGFDEADEKKFITDAQEKARIDIATYENAQNQKLEALSDFKKSERELIEQNSQYRIDAISLDQTLSATQKEQAIADIKAEAEYKLNQLELTHAKAMQQSQSWMQSEAERIRNVAALERQAIRQTLGMAEELRQAEIDRISAEEERQIEQLNLARDQAYQQATAYRQTAVEQINAQYDLEREQITLTVQHDAELRQAQLDANEYLRQQTLDQRRFAHERELESLQSTGMSELEKIRQQFRWQRQDIDRDDSKTPEEKSALRNAMMGSEIYAIRQYKDGVRSSLMPSKHKWAAITIHINLNKASTKNLRLSAQLKR